MSIIAQARLTPLSHKCLSVMPWRSDIRDVGAQSLHPFYSSPARMNTSIGRESTQDGKQEQSHRNLDLGYGSRTQYSSLRESYHRKTQLFSKHLVDDPQGIRALNLDLYPDAPERSVFDAPEESQDLTVLTRSHKVFPHIHTNQNSFLTPGQLDIHTRVPQPSPGINSSRKENHRRSHNRTYKKSHVLSVMGIFGLLGRKAQNDDIADEKAKLTDEEKVKRMKPVDLCIAKGVLSMCDQDYLRANQLFHEALEIAQGENDQEKETLILNLLAANFFEFGDFVSAEKLFIELIKRLLANDAEPTDPAILELSLKLASIYSKDSESQEKALKGYKFVINSLLASLQNVLIGLEEVQIQDLSEEIRNQLALLGWSYEWFGKYLIELNDYTRASEMLQKALEISSKILGPLHDQTLILLNDVGTTLAMNGASEKAKEFIQKAVEGGIESKSNELPSFYVNLGRVYLKLKQFSEAQRFCEFSMELASKNRQHHSSYEVMKMSRNCLSDLKLIMSTQKPH